MAAGRVLGLDRGQIRRSPVLLDVTRLFGGVLPPALPAKLEQERLIYQARLQARFGRNWRRKAPVESMMPLRLAKYGVPLAETAPAGLAAAGIEPALLPPAPKAELPYESQREQGREHGHEQGQEQEQGRGEQVPQQEQPPAPSPQQFLTTPSARRLRRPPRSRFRRGPAGQGRCA